MPVSTPSSSRTGATLVNSTAPSTFSGTPQGKSKTKEKKAGGLNTTPAIEEDDEETRSKLTRLNFLLEKSTAYASILALRLQEDQERTRRDREAATLKANDSSSPTKKTPAPAPTPTASLKGRKSGRKRAAPDESGAENDSSSKRARLDDNPDETPSEPITSLAQPPLITATLKEYQLQGVQWMLSLHENGLNGILADEMGLGKTLQTIAFIAHLKSKFVQGPILVVAPLSVVHNWAAEFEKFAPEIPALIYHGSPEERAVLRKEVLFRRPAEEQDRSSTSPKPTGRRERAKTRSKASEKSEEGSPVPDKPKKQIDKFPVILTTYEMIIRDRTYLSTLDWKYIIVDEGHRLKNMDSKLMQEIKRYPSANRMILTGTPLHNNLAELWSLLNFILPDIFNDLDSFQQWYEIVYRKFHDILLTFQFNLPSTTADSDGSEPILNESHTQHIITSLHGILKPFLLRRIKADVETNIPPKKEYVLYAPLTRSQVEIYEAILSRKVRQWLINNFNKDLGLSSTSKGIQSDEPDDPSSEEEDEDGNRKMRLRRRGEVNYDIVDDDEEYFARLEDGTMTTRSKTGPTARGRKIKEKTAADIGREFARKQALKAVNNMSLQNTIMQLRKVCSHPFLFAWPVDPETREPIIGDGLVNASGKMLLLDRLLEALIGKNAKQDSERPHKVLLFSQFVTMLDVIEDWAHEHKGWVTCRIDGSTSPQDRREQMDLFNKGGNGPEAPRLFLLSTRAGGLGINLVEADTVVFYDQDWNPQMDLQAQDRAHRIGQTRPVLIFRLVANHTVETKIMSRAGEKRKLEALVIAKGKFKVPHGKQPAKQESIADMAAALLRLESEKIHVVSAADDKDNVISDESLEMLLDRRPEVFEERGKGWKKDGTKTVQAESDITRTAFEVFEGVRDETNDGLARMMGDSDEE